MNENTTNIGTLGLADDSGMGLAMFAIFTAACLIVTGAVAILAFINAWWVLGLAFGIHVLMTTAVGYAVFSALSGDAASLREPARSRAADEAEALELAARTRLERGEAHPAAA